MFNSKSENDKNYWKKINIWGHKIRINLVVERLKKYVGFIYFIQTLSFVIIIFLTLVILNVILKFL